MALFSTVTHVWCKFIAHLQSIAIYCDNLLIFMYLQTFIWVVLCFSKGASTHVNKHTLCRTSNTEFFSNQYFTWRQSWNNRLHCYRRDSFANYDTTVNGYTCILWHPLSTGVYRHNYEFNKWKLFTSLVEYSVHNYVVWTDFISSFKDDHLNTPHVLISSCGKIEP